MRRHLIVGLLTGALALSATVSQAQLAVPQINYKQLSKHPFEAPHGIKVTVERFNAGRLVMSLTNTSTSFVAWTPEDMAIVEESGNQLFLRGEFRDPMLPLPKLRIAPGATVQLNAWLSDPEQFPVKVYVFDALCALVTE